MKKLFVLVLLISAFTTSGLSQANDTDTKNPDALIEALYDVISGPAGVRDWDRFRNLFCEGATINSVALTPEGEQYRPGTIHEYIDGTADLFANQSFYEWEIGRKMHEMDNLVQVFSAFECKLGGKLSQTGVNSIQLVRVEGKWNIAHLTFNTHDKPALEEYFE